MSDPTYTELCRSASLAAQLLQGKWEIPILCAVQKGPVRLGQLMRLYPTASKKVIAENLRQLERDHILLRTDFSRTLLHVEYDFAEELRSEISQVLRSLADLCDTHKTLEDLRTRPGLRARGRF